MGNLTLSSDRGRVKRFMGTLVVGALVAAGAVVGVAAPASAATGGPAPIEQRSASTVTADSLPTVQIDSGVVWAQAIAGNTVYAGGSFSNARPAGAAPGTNLMPRFNLLAYNIDTGVATSFAPNINGTVKSLAVSPDGKRLYVGGSFNSVDGQTRWNFAAFDTATGTLLSNFKPAIGGAYVNAIVATNSTVYVGGLIGAAVGVTRKGLAAVTTSGALLSWAPTTDLQVDAMVLAPGGDKLIIGGRFSTVNDVSQRGLAALDLTTGSILPWAAPATVQNGMGTGSDKGKAGISALTADASGVYGTGWVFADRFTGNLEGLFAADGGTGDIRWIADCHGDHYGVYSDGTEVYSTSHEHDCSTAGGYPQADPAPGNMRHATAYTTAAKGTLLRSPSAGNTYADWSGYPAPAAINWYPDWTTGTATGQGQAGWTMTGNGTYLLVGGEFPNVNGQRQQGLARFSKQPAGGAKQGPRLSGDKWVPSATSSSAGSVRIGIPSNWDRDDLNLTYTVREQGSNAVLATKKSSSSFWNLPGLSVMLKGIAPGSTHTYRVTATDPDGNSATSAWTTVTVGDGVPSDYVDRVLDDGASLYWRLGGAAGGTDIAGTNNATFYGNPASSDDDALATEANGSAKFDGATAARTTTAVKPGTTFAAQVWFKTDSTRGGKLFGYGNSDSADDSGNFDRHVYMGADGRISFGVYPNRVAAVTSSASYNDDRWHNVVAQLSPSVGIQLYVDGVLVGADSSATSGQDYTGYWRIGGDNVNGWPNSGNSKFDGLLDEFAVYPNTLTADQIAAQIAIAKGPYSPPVAAIDADHAGLVVKYGASGSTTSADEIVTGYNWDFGDGATSTDAAPTHAYASPGTYDVKLVVTDTRGTSSSQVVKHVVVASSTTPIDAYTQKVLSDGASLLWPLGGPRGHLDWAGTNNAVASPGITSSGDSVFTDADAGSDTFDGIDASLHSADRVAVSSPFSAEIWFKTTSTSGGKLFGMGGSASGSSGSYDRHLYMANDGTLLFGGYTGNTATVQSTTSFNDGQWHQAVGQISGDGTKLYVDGELVASNDSYTGSETSANYWRIGGDTLSGWPSQPSSFYFGGQLSDFSVYTRSLSAAEVAEHNSIARGIVPPTASFVVSGSGATREFDGSSSLASTGRSIVAYSWDFGDGATQTGAVATHAYAEPGTFTVTLTVTDSAGKLGVHSEQVVVSPPHAAPVAKFTSTVSGLSVAFDASTSSTSDAASLASYAWDFGDGKTSTDASPTHVYAHAGTYTVTLKVTDSTGSDSAAVTSDVVVVHSAPVAKITSAAIGLSVAFDASTSSTSDAATLSSYAWDFGDGTTSSDASPTHVYALAGTYTVTLKVTDSMDSDSSLATADVVVAPVHVAPVAKFTSTVSGLSVAFDASTSSTSDAATLASYAWDFGDGKTSTDASPTHVYAHAGTYTVTLKVTDSTGAQSVAATADVVAIAPHVAPVAKFTSTVSGLSVAFDASTSSTSDAATLASYAWDFGDGKTSTDASPTHVYAHAATYTVTLKVTDSTGAQSAAATADVAATHAKPVAAFESPIALLNVVTDASDSKASDGATLTYEWNWGDDTAATSGVTSSHDYAQSGTYDITLTVTDSLGASDTLKKTVTVAALSVIARDDFDRTLASGWGNAVVGGAWTNLTGLSVAGGAGQLSLKPGDTRAPMLGSVSAADSLTTMSVTSDKAPTGGGLHFNVVVHKSAAGDYRLKARIQADGSVLVSITRMVGTAETTLASKTISGYAFSAGDQLQLKLETSTAGASTTLRGKVWPASATEPSSWTVSTTDATAALQASGSVGILAYLSGSSNAPLKVAVGNFLVTKKGASTHGAPVAAISAKATGLTVGFTSADSTTSDGATITGYAWDFGDGETSTSASPSHKYAQAGDYTVKLRVTDSLGLTSTPATKRISTTHANPTATFDASDSNLKVSVDASQSSASDGASLSYSWNWGDQTAAGSGATASHTYANAGTYTVVLTVTDSLGAVKTVSRDVSVAAAPVVDFLVKDDFDRAVATGWGTSPTGGGWDSTAGFSVAGGVGKIQVNAGQTRTNTLSSVNAREADIAMDVSGDKLANSGGLYFSVLAHKSAVGDYRLRLRTTTTGSVVLWLSKLVGATETQLASKTVAGLVYSPATTLHIRFRVTTAGASTGLEGKLWADNASEPSAFTVSASDNTAGLQASGQLGVQAYVSGGASNAPLTVSVDNLTVR